MNQPDEKPLYTLTYYTNGQPTNATATTDIRKARQEYQERYNSGGQLPLLKINGANVSRRKANQLMRLKRWPKPERKPAYVNRPEKKPKTP